MPFAQFSAFCCHIDPENTTVFLRAVWTWWLNHVAERGREQDPGSTGSLSMNPVGLGPNL